LPIRKSTSPSTKLERPFAHHDSSTSRPTDERGQGTRRENDFDQTVQNDAHEMRKRWEEQDRKKEREREREREREWERETANQRERENRNMGQNTGTAPSLSPPSLSPRSLSHSQSQVPLAVQPLYTHPPKAKPARLFVPHPLEREGGRGETTSVEFAQRKGGQEGGELLDFVEAVSWRITDCKCIYTPPNKLV